LYQSLQKQQHKKHNHPKSTSNNEAVSQHTTGLSTVLKKTPPRVKQTNKQGLEVKQEILWTLYERKKQGQYNKQHKKATPPHVVLVGRRQIIFVGCHQQGC
jgi:hypothetical protein